MNVFRIRLISPSPGVKCFPPKVKRFSVLGIPDVENEDDGNNFETGGDLVVQLKTLLHSRLPECSPQSTTGRRSTLSPIFCCNQFGEFPLPVWAVASCSSGPQAWGTPQIDCTEYRTQGAAPPCMYTIQSVHRASVLVSGSVALPEGRPLAGGLQDARPLECTSFMGVIQRYKGGQ